MFCTMIGSCSRCKIVVTKYHLLQFALLWGMMANSPTCPSQLAPAPHFVLSDTRINMKAFYYQSLIIIIIITAIIIIIIIVIYIEP